MLQSRDKISLRQALLMCIVVEFSPTVRLAGSYAAKAAKQAGWISAILSAIPIVILLFILKAFYKKKYKEAHFMDIIKDIMGNILGRIIIVMYFIWLLLLWVLYTRYFAERLVGTVAPNVNISIFIIAMLIMATIALRSGITVIARMNEIIVLIIIFALYSLFLFSLPLVKINNITPIYFTDILPAFSGSIVFWALYGYLLVFFFFGNQINDKEKLLKFGMYKGIVLVISNTMLILFIIGSLGSSLTSRLPWATFVWIKQISVFGVVERIESIALVLWVLSDFMIISVFAYAMLYIIKDFFKLSNYKPLVIPFTTWGYFLSLLITNNTFELEKASNVFFIPANIVLEYAVPLLILIVGKIRKKV